ncbi:MAG: hypothetical protein ABL876_00040 [Chitinophagaceae bacterium]
MMSDNEEYITVKVKLPKLQAEMLASIGQFEDIATYNKDIMLRFKNNIIEQVIDKIKIKYPKIKRKIWKSQDIVKGLTYTFHDSKRNSYRVVMVDGMDVIAERLTPNSAGPAGPLLKTNVVDIIGYLNSERAVGYMDTIAHTERMSINKPSE